MPLDPNSFPSTGNPYIEAARLFYRGYQFLNSLPFGDDAISKKNRRAAKRAGYTRADGYSRGALEAIGAGLRSNFAQYFNPRDNGPRLGIAPAAPQTPLPSQIIVERPPPWNPTGILGDLLKKPRAPSDWERILKMPRNSVPDVVSKVPKPVAVGAGSVAALIIGILWPSKIGDASWDLRYPKRPATRTQPKRKGPSNRRRVKYRRPVVLIPAPPVPQPEPRVQPRPTRTPGPLESPQVVVTPSPVTVPLPSPVPSPSALPWSALAPFALPAAFAALAPQPNRAPRRAPLTDFLSDGLPSPRTNTRTEPQDDCSCSKPSRPKRSKESKCTNKIVRKTTREKDGRLLQTITRELKCPGSSRKRRP